MAQSVDHFYYHYTSTAGANDIRNEGRLWSQSGVQLSTLNPEEHTRDVILRSIYGNRIPNGHKNRADNVVYVSEDYLDMSKLSKVTPQLYQYSGEININDDDVRDKPRCVNGARGSGTGSSNAQSSSKMFFYTNTKNAQAIKSSNVIPYDRNRPIFLTTMKPEDNFRDEILNTIYGRDYDRSQFASSADWCVKIDDSKLNGAKLQVSKQSSKVRRFHTY